MKRRFEFLYTLCILFVLATGASAQYGPESKFLLQVGAEYVGRPLIKTEFNKEDLEKYGDVTQFRHYRFTSDRVGDKYVNFNPELSLTAYVYKDPETPISSLSRLQEASKNWKIKTPEVAIVHGNSLYRLKGHCDVPDNTWQWMVEELYDSVLGRGKEPESVFVLSCGQERNPVKEKPLEDKRPVLKRRDGDSETPSAFAP